ncbi:hypothetical protein CC80DRAFT_499537 [Byssothecium circinans]|uniref:Uncharacterized protein n=1 Tax=Byssothecium circinans TaxID=147558 RepID=A0A6A5UM08_9PLEO|nr:hypothetical protein CC80DRAFT_499537 [Byssothecium circinans]
MDASVLRGLLSSPLEIQCEILRLLADNLDAYSAVIQQPEIARVLQFNFKTQLRLLRKWHPGPHANELQSILVTVVLVRIQGTRSTKKLVKLLDASLQTAEMDFKPSEPNDAVEYIHQYNALHSSTKRIAASFAFTNLSRYASTPRDAKPPSGLDLPTTIEKHRIQRAIYRLHLYVAVCNLPKSKRKRNRQKRVKLLFTRGTSWEFDEIRSIAEWIISRFPRKNQMRCEHAYDRQFFEHIHMHFEQDTAPLVYNSAAKKQL